MPEREEDEGAVDPKGSGGDRPDSPCSSDPRDENQRTEIRRTEVEQGADPGTTGFEGAGTDGALLRMAFGADGLEVHEPSMGAWAPKPLGIGDVLGGRYALEGELGQGGVGRVFRGRDRIGRDEVAVKVLKAGALRIRDLARREIGVLRFLQVPGVARLRDEGTERGCPYFVMDLIEGRPFPGGVGQDSEPVPWEKLAPVVHSLLEVLGRVHGHGLAHLDLKPANVLVDPEGRIGLLDFGISEGAAVGDLAGHTDAATKEYASPEKLRGGTVGVRSDLYSLGVMIYRCLTGERPCPLGAQGMPEFHRTESIRVHLPNLNEEVAHWIDRLLEPNPEDRPASIHSGLRVVSGDSEVEAEEAGWRSLLPSLDGAGEGRFTERQLWEVFQGPDIVLHLREDGARELWRRTLGCPDRIADVLSAWERAGLAHRVGPRYSVQRMALERLKQGTRIAPPPLRRGGRSRPLDELDRQILRTLEVDWPEGNPERLARILAVEPDRLSAPISRLVEEGWILDGPGMELHPVALEDVSMILPEDHLMVARAQEAGEPKRLYHWIEAGELDAAVEEALNVGSRRFRDGRHAEAEGVLLEGLAAAQMGAYREGEELLLRQPLEVAMTRMDVAPLERALFELSRASEPSEALHQLEELLEAAIMARASSGDQAAEHLESLPEYLDPELEVWRCGLLSQANQRVSLDASREFIKRIEAKPMGSLGRTHAGRLHIWRATLAYREHSFEASANEYAKARECEGLDSIRVATLGSEATSWLEDGEPSRASKLAEELLAWAGPRRDPMLETWARWILRTSAYRRGEDLDPLCGWLNAVDMGSSVVMRGPIHMQESVFHWRAGRLREALQCSEDAHRVWRDVASDSGMLISGAMVHRSRQELGEASPYSQLEPWIETCELPRIVAQSVSLLASAGIEVPPSWIERGRSCVRQLDIADPTMRWEILSLNEILEGLGLPSV